MTRNTTATALAATTPANTPSETIALLDRFRDSSSKPRNASSDCETEASILAPSPFVVTWRRRCHRAMLECIANQAIAHVRASPADEAHCMAELVTVTGTPQLGV